MQCPRPITQHWLGSTIKTNNIYEAVAYDYYLCLQCNISPVTFLQEQGCFAVSMEILSWQILCTHKKFNCFDRFIMLCSLEQKNIWNKLSLALAMIAFIHISGMHGCCLIKVFPRAPLWFHQFAGLPWYYLPEHISGMQDLKWSNISTKFTWWLYNFLQFGFFFVDLRCCHTTYSRGDRGTMRRWLYRRTDWTK